MAELPQPGIKAGVKESFFEVFLSRGLPLSQLHPDGPVAKCINKIIDAILQQTDKK